jgi:Na+-translocating ferredoxin:NAD+ oxidoreductase RnfG subunit
MIRLASLLVVTGLLAGAAPGMVPDGTKPAAETQQATAAGAARLAVLPEAGCGILTRHVFVVAPGDTLVYYRGYRNADTTGLCGYVVSARGRGYMGAVETTAGVDLSGRITGLKITAHKETPGLGDKIAEVKPAKTVSERLKQLPDAAAARPAALMVEQASGSRCVVAGVRDVAVFASLEKALLAGDAAGVAGLAPRAIDAGADSALLLDPALALAISQKLVQKLGEDPAAWWPAQFVGRSRANLVLSKAKSDSTIQGITGATISSSAVTEPVKNAIVKLEKAVGGFKEMGK